jgi:2-hydroxychromene-2-carboxylate isomerase
VGSVVSLSDHRAPSAVPRARATLFVDLASPWSYLAVERAEALLAPVAIRPASAEALHRGTPGGEPGERERVARRAAELRLPLIWPAEPWRPVPAAMRVAALAATRGCATEFTLAAGRLAYCGGFRLDEPESLAEAAAAAGLELTAALQAAGDPRWDGLLESTGRALLSGGADRLPAVICRGRLYCGEGRVAEAAAYGRARMAG